MRGLNLVVAINSCARKGPWPCTR